MFTIIKIIITGTIKAANSKTKKFDYIFHITNSIIFDIIHNLIIKLMLELSGLFFSAIMSSTILPGSSELYV